MRLCRVPSVRDHDAARRQRGGGGRPGHLGAGVCIGVPRAPRPGLDERERAREVPALRLGARRRSVELRRCSCSLFSVGAQLSSEMVMGRCFYPPKLGWRAERAGCAPATRVRSVSAAGAAYVFAIAHALPRSHTRCSSCSNAPRCAMDVSVSELSERLALPLDDAAVRQVGLLSGAFVVGCCAFWCCVQPLLVWCRRRVHGEPVLI